MTKNKKQLIITSIVCVLPMIVGAILYTGRNICPVLGDSQNDWRKK